MALNVLVVDDSSVIRAMVIKTLRLSGVELGEVHQAGDGQAGLDALEAHWVDLLLADLNMPVMDGEEMIRRVRANPQSADLPILVISSEGSETRIAELGKLNVRFIHKPFTPESIRRTVVDMLGLEHEQTNA